MHVDSDSSASADSRDAKQLLASPVESLRGVRSKHVSLLKRLKLFTARDLLFNFPRDYQDLSDERLIADLDEGQLLSIRGRVAEVSSSSRGFGKSKVSILLADESGHLRATWFNQPFMQRFVTC